jgi:hypothetical protein
MPFSSSTVDPSLMDAMRAAFNRVCDVLQLSCDREDPLTEVVVTKIVDLAKAGERDPEKLCFFREQLHARDIFLPTDSASSASRGAVSTANDSQGVEKSHVFAWTRSPRVMEALR